MRLGAIPVPGTSLLVAKGELESLEFDSSIRNPSNPADLQFRANACGAVAFVGDAESTSRFEEIAKEVNISKIWQVRVDNDSGLGRGRKDFQAAVAAVPEGEKWKGPAHSSSDLALLYFTSGTTGDPKMVLLESEYTLGHTITGSWYQLGPGKREFITEVELRAKAKLATRSRSLPQHGRSRMGESCLLDLRQLQSRGNSARSASSCRQLYPNPSPRSPSPLPRHQPLRSSDHLPHPRYLCIPEVYRDPSIQGPRALRERRRATQRQCDPRMAGGNGGDD